MKHDLSETCHLFFSTLSNPTRLAILELLRKRPKNVTEIAEALNQEQSMISHNLRPLERCKFVFSEKRKRERIYALNKETMEPIFKIFSHHAKKYCPTRGECLTTRHLKERKKREAASPLYLSRH
ncbi:ArsR family transcriptional regulator [Candidatus Bathyarchaeota archaeon]|nr:winged helix-turn-helix transcriptional regulator [Candidatus Bathyarchaeota archaeon]TET62207.1 MAG: ArsR family transcriptional regulator [Candidatus Bathyarchaeota archaeon]